MKYLLYHDQTQEYKFRSFYAMSVHKNYFNFDEIFYCGMTRLRNKIFNYCDLCQYMKAIKPKKETFRESFKISKFYIQ